MQIIPIEGVGTLVTGVQQDDMVEVWNGNLVTLTRLPGGRCLVPLAGGRVSVRNGPETYAETVIDTTLGPRLGSGRFALEGRGTLHVWPFVAEADVGVLAGERPAASAPGRIDLERRALPHRVMTLAVQVRDGPRCGPVRFVAYRPDAHPCPVSVDHASSHNGPVTHIQVDPAGLERVEVEVVRRIRQTGQERTSRYEINSRDDLITFEDLLHGDELEMLARPPFALTGADGSPVQGRRFRYRAVPEPRLEPLPDERPLEVTGGLALVDGGDAPELMAGITDGGLTWRHEWPRAGVGDHPSLVAALRGHLGDVEADIARDPAGLRWWLGVVEAGQDPRGAAELVHHGIACSPQDVDRVAAAARLLDGFPAHVFAELDAQGPGPDVIAFQERLGMATQDGAQVARLADATRTALEAAVAGWQADLAGHRLEWIDGTVPPLEHASSLEELAQRLQEDAHAGLQDLWERRNHIWSVAPGEARPPVDRNARSALLAWHLASTARSLDAFGRLMEAAGASMPTGPVHDLEGLARRLGEALRAAEPAIARLEAVPVTGSRFVDDAAGRGVELHPQLRAWTHLRVPAAVRLQAERAMQRWDRRLLARTAVWSTFMTEAPRILHELDALVRDGGPDASRASALMEQLEQAAARRDTQAFASAQARLRNLEPALIGGQALWASLLATCSPSTRAALGLHGVEAWDDVRERVHADAHAIQDLAARVEGLGHDVPPRVGYGLTNAVRRLDAAEPGPSCAEALLAYDKVRQRIAASAGGDEPVAALGAVYAGAVRDDLAARVKRIVWRPDGACLAALEANSDIAGAAELRLLLRALDQELDMAALEGLEAMMERVEGSDPWRRIRERVRARLRDAMPDLRRYLAEAAPRWAILDDADNAIQWLHAMANGRRDERTGTDPASLAPGNRRLMEHALRERGIWLG